MKSLFDIIRYIADSLECSLQTNPANSIELSRARIKAQIVQLELKGVPSLVEKGALAIGHPFSDEETSHMIWLLGLVARQPAVAAVRVPAPVSPKTPPASMEPTAPQSPISAQTGAGDGPSSSGEASSESSESSSDQEIPPADTDPEEGYTRLNPPRPAPTAPAP